ncbi:MAG: hypothetical protein ACI84R_003399, partial [Candidatus Azotimanducaceae bacterium]
AASATIAVLAIMIRTRAHLMLGRILICSPSFGLVFVRGF